MFWSLKNTEITIFSMRLKFYFIILLQVFSSMTGTQSSSTENWKERELTKRDLWIKHIKSLCTAGKLRACCWQHGFACLCAFAGKWRSLYRESARSHTPAGHLPSGITTRPLCHPVSPAGSSLSPAQPGASRAHAHLPAGEDKADTNSHSPQGSTSAPCPSRLFYPGRTPTSEIVMHL